jgi:hypothetical protein
MNLKNVGAEKLLVKWSQYEETGTERIDCQEQSYKGHSTLFYLILDMGSVANKLAFFPPEDTYGAHGCVAVLLH